jgi:hypothetical protein
MKIDSPFHSAMISFHSSCIVTPQVMLAVDKYSMMFGNCQV